MTSQAAKLAVLYDAFYGPHERRGEKRRLEEILDLNVKYLPLLDEREDLKRARLSYVPHEIELPYTTRNLFGGNNLFNLPDLTVPAFGRDDDLAGKFDLIQNKLTKLSTPLQPNHLAFQFMGLNRIPYTQGEFHLSGDPLKAAVQMEVYDQREEVPMDDGDMYSLRELQLESRLSKNVQANYNLLLGTPTVDPLATLITFPDLKKFQDEFNNIILSQYSKTMRGETYIRLKESVVEEHGADSVAALLVHMQSPQVFLDTFFPRGIFSSGFQRLEGVVTLQTMGQLHVDIEDGDSHLMPGSMVSSGAVLYLVVQMQPLVDGECLFNYPAMKMVLSPKSTCQLADDILIRTKGRCHRTRSGKLSKTVIWPVGHLRAGPHHVYDPSKLEARQYSQFEILLGHVKPMYVTFSKSF